MRAVTDEGPQTPGSEMSEPIKNLFTLLELVSTPDVVTHFRAMHMQIAPYVTETSRNSLPKTSSRLPFPSANAYLTSATTRITSHAWFEKARNAHANMQLRHLRT